MGCVGLSHPGSMYNSVSVVVTDATIAFIGGYRVHFTIYMFNFLWLTQFCLPLQNDKLVKIWQQLPPDSSEDRSRNYSFVYANHPKPVRGLEWRQTSPVIPPWVLCKRMDMFMLSEYASNLSQRVWHSSTNIAEICSTVCDNITLILHLHSVSVPFL